MLFIEHKQEIKKEVYEEIRGQKEPLYCVGIGNVAHEVYHRLLEHNIPLTGFVVNNQIGQNSFYGLPLWKLGKLLENLKNPINLIIGHAQYHKKAELEQLEYVNKVFYILSPFKTHEDISYEYFEEHRESYEKAYELFEEDFSKEIFQAYLNTKINKDLSYLLKSFKNVNTFFENDVFSLGSQESYVDVGAYTGDTIMKFYHAVQGNYKNIYAFEPDSDFYSQLIRCVEETRLRRINCYPVGLWKEKTVLTFAKDQQQSGRVVSIGELVDKIEVDAMDQILSGCEISLIKINMGGAFECLQGAKSILKEQHPKIVVTVGLERQCLHEIPRFIKETDATYRLFLRFNESMPDRLTLYAI